MSSSLRVIVGPRTLRTSQSPKNFGVSFEGTQYRCVCCTTRTRLPGLYCLSIILSFVSRLSTAVSEADYLARDLIRPLKIFSTSATIVQMSRGGLGSGVRRSFGKTISRPEVNRYGVNSVASEIVDQYACNTGDSSGYQSYGRFYTARRSIEMSARLNLSHFPFA